MEEFRRYGADADRKRQALFAGLFVVQNRLQNACEKLQTEISMRQWHLLAMAEACEREKTLTNIGRLMGCSRQNVRRLADALERRGFVRTAAGPNNAVLLETTERAERYLAAMGPTHAAVLTRLFSRFTPAEADTFFSLFDKLLDGVAQVEQLAESAPAEREV